MTPYFLLNDCHIGRKASGGVTQESAYALRKHLLKGFHDSLNQATGDVVLLGDIFDTFSVDVGDLLEAYDVVCDWLHERGHRLVCVIGNHDQSSDSMKTSSFDLFTGLLERRFPALVTTVRGGQLFPEYDSYVLSHVKDQATFDAELEKVPDCKYLLLHANWNNFFSVEADHSLNVTESQAKQLAKRGITLVFAHVHQQKTEMAGSVVIIGNQTCASIADALGNDTKTMMSVSDEGLKRLQTWKAEGSFFDCDWKSLDDLPESAQFIRTVGTATSAQAADVIAALARKRASCSAFLLSNAVEIAGLNDSGSLDVSLEQIKSFSVLGALMEILSPEEGAKVQKLLGEQVN